MPTKTAKLPSQSKLREDFTYNAGTGDFTRYDGSYGHIDRSYWYICIDGRRIQTHRLIWKWWYGYDPEYIDHINGDGLDNRIDNLRNVDHKTNLRNNKKNKNNTSGFTGVVWHELANKWVARVKIEYKYIHIGLYNTPEEARDARNEFLKEFFPNLFTERHGK